MKAIYTKDCKTCPFLQKDTICMYCGKQFTNQISAMKANMFIKKIKDDIKHIIIECPLPNIDDTLIVKKSEKKKIKKPLIEAYDLGCLHIINKIYAFYDEDLRIKKIIDDYNKGNSSCGNTIKVCKNDMDRLLLLLR